MSRNAKKSNVLSMVSGGGANAAATHGGSVSQPAPATSNPPVYAPPTTKPPATPAKKK
jgi:hypothetical protein